MAASDNQFTIGNNVRVTIIGPFGEIDLKHVTDFDAKPKTTTINVKPLNAPTIEDRLPDGWDFSFSVERGNAAVDQLQAALETTHWGGGVIPKGTMTQQITEVDGSVTTWTYSDVSLSVTDAGKFSQNASVKQMVAGFARRRFAG